MRCAGVERNTMLDVFADSVEQQRAVRLHRSVVRWCWKCIISYSLYIASWYVCVCVTKQYRRAIHLGKQKIGNFVICAPCRIIITALSSYICIWLVHANLIRKFEFIILMLLCAVVVILVLVVVDALCMFCDSLYVFTTWNVYCCRYMIQFLIAANCVYAERVLP